MTEAMPDGRSIHYYEWPDDDEAKAASESGTGAGQASREADEPSDTAR